jgi:hypothetical protein
MKLLGFFLAVSLCLAAATSGAKMLNTRQREAFATSRAREAIQLIRSSLSNPELRDEEVRAALMNMDSYIRRNGISIATPEFTEECKKAVAYVGIDNRDLIYFCPLAYDYEVPEYLIHELYHVIYSDFSGSLHEECMADLVASVVMITAVKPEDLVITSRPSPRGNYRNLCPEEHWRSTKYHRTLAEQTVSSR